MVSFEDLYIALKEKEGRKLKPAQIKRLPELPKGHPWTKEWEFDSKIWKVRNFIRKSCAIDCSSIWR